MRFAGMNGRVSAATFCLAVSTGVMVRGLAAQAQVSQPRQGAIQAENGSATQHAAAAEAHEQAGDAVVAAAEWRAVLAINPASTGALDHLSTDLLQMRDYLSIVNLLRPRPPAALSAVQTVKLAEALAVLARLPEAIELLRGGVQRFPNALPIADELSAVLMLAGRKDEAYAELETTLKRHPEDEPTRVLYLRSLITGKSDKAASVAQALVTKYPADAQVQYLGALLAWQTGDLTRSRELAERALALNPRDASAQKLAGDILMHQEDLPGAKVHFEEAVRLGDTEPQVRYKLAQISRKLNDSTSAQRDVELYKSLRTSETNSIGAAEAVDKGDQALAARDAAAAVTLYQQAIELKPDEPLIHYKLSTAYDQQNDIVREKLALQRAVQLSPNFAEALNQLGYLAEKSGELSEAEVDFQSAVKASPLYVVAWTNLAATLTGEGKWQPAREAADHALRLDPANATARRIQDLLKGPLPRE